MSPPAKPGGPIGSLTFRPERTESPRPGSLILHGAFTAGAQAIPVQLRYDASEAGDELAVSLEGNAQGSPSIARWTYPLPLKLDRHKRVYLRGDQHLSWDERYTYQFHLNTSFALLPQPDFTEWR